MQGVSDMEKIKPAIQAVVFNKHGIGHIARVERFPKPGETIRAIEWKFGEDAGKGTNVAVALGRQGIRAAFIGKAGEDAEGRLGEKWLKEAGVDTSHYILTSDIKTDVGIVVTQEDGENMVIGSPLHKCFISLDEVKKAIDDFADTKYFITGLEIDPVLPFLACRYAKEKGMTTLFNPSPLHGKIELPLDYVDYLFVNEHEGMELAEADDKKGWMEIAGMVWNRYRPQVVVMTLGDAGCVLCEGGMCTYLPSYQVECVDTVAAGDGFMAAFAAGLIRGMNHEEAADWGNRYAAVVVEREGAILSYPTLEEAKQISDGFMKRQINEGA